MNISKIYFVRQPLFDITLIITYLVLAKIYLVGKMTKPLCKIIWSLWNFILLLACLTAGAQTDFTLIKGGILYPQVYQHLSKDSVRLDDFEIMNYPVTNAEYQDFVTATGHQAPNHWSGGTYPNGKGDHPVIFVNRWDVQSYLEWRSQLEDRVYRLPTVIEYEYAAKGGLDSKYPWGENADTTKANYDDSGNRDYEDWETYLQKAAFGNPNGYGLYGMAGNVFELCLDNFDPAVTRWKFRVSEPLELERAVMGGSWARSQSYMQIGIRLGISPGLRLPDVGFRLVRSPSQTDWHQENRRLSAVTDQNDDVFLSWSLLESDTDVVGFNIYRAYSRASSGMRINNTPISKPFIIDSTATIDNRYYYYVKPIRNNQKEGRRSEWVGITVGNNDEGRIAKFRPIHTSKKLVPVFGDLTGDGTRDCVIRMDNGIVEMSQDPGTWVQLEAFTSYGRSLWRRNLADHESSFGNANNVPFCLWDMDGDGRDEVMARMTINDTTYLAMLDGITGKVTGKTKWTEMATDLARSSSRIHMSIAYLDGNNPFVITQTGLYENEIISAFDAKLNKVWEYQSFAETSGSGSHRIVVADVDGDGRQEIFDGTTCLNSDGSLRWSIFRGHPDLVSINDFLPERPGLEVYFMVETSVHAGIYMADADTGKILWKINREDDPRWLHGHHGWVSDIWDGSAGLECLSNRAGHSDHHMLLFSSDGKLLQDGFPFGYHPLEWDGDETKELINHQGIGEYNGSEVIPIKSNINLPENSTLLMAADLYGDTRDELVYLIEPENQPAYVEVIGATHPINQWYVTPSASLDYRLWLARNMGGGYKSVYYHRPRRVITK